MFIVIYGPEGSGKTTQGKMLAQKLKLPHLVSGDLVRRYAKQDQGIIGEVCQQAIKKGHYVADSEMFVMWKARLKEKDLQKGFVIDGFPRNMSQALFLDDKLDKYHKEVNLAVHLKVSEKTSVQRLLERGRCNPDGSLADSKENIKERLRRYKSEEKDVIDFYQDRGVLCHFNGEQTIKDVHQQLLAKALEIKKNLNAKANRLKK